MPRKPLIGVSACTKQIGHHSFHIAGDKYLRAAAIAGVPLVIPALDELIDPATLLETFDGLLFTGSPSNVEPHHYGGPASETGTHHDPLRDRLTLPLIRAAVEAGIPVFGICRGFQENAALTIAATVTARRYLPRNVSGDGPDINDNITRLVGARGEAASIFAEGRGRVHVEGKEWDAISDDALIPGKAVEVLAVLSAASLKVKAA
ncbi:MAG: gamma-glutamyl-gamma-aminobutyrate hydrolase family protein [Gammaproteobacteria bacterium]|nr:gamma-glutamyl-gamma-aminobutyrate hydrolase family protein [Gammaproteobacteria bacterium]